MAYSISHRAGNVAYPTNPECPTMAAKLSRVMALDRSFRFRLAAVAMMDTDKGKLWPTPKGKPVARATKKGA